jgi:two-component system, OmpR family, KDP operon response regulator KdpE
VSAASVRILVVEDEAPIRRFLRASLESQGFQMLEAVTGAEGLSLAASNAPDLILLDLGLPDLDGIELLAKLRGFSEVPVIILSARGKERDKIDGLDAGADDYLTKPFSVGELAARIRVAFRHRMQSGSAGVLVVEFGEVRVDLEARKVTRRGADVHLTPNEFKVLAVLVRNAGRVVTTKQMLKEVWGTTLGAREHYVRLYVHQLRQKLEARPAQPEFLISEPWVGYRLEAEP